MMSENLPGDSTSPRLGELSRIIGVFFEPAKAFEDIAARPRFVVPLVLVTLMTLGYMAAFSQRVGWERMIRQKIEQNPRTAQLNEEQKEQQIAMSSRFVSIGGYVGALVV